MPVALIVLVLAAGWRIAAIHFPALANVTPLMALVLCGAVYFPARRLWLAPLAALVLSDLYLDQYYAAAEIPGPGPARSCARSASWPPFPWV